MDREAIIARLREKETESRARGVSHAALFGSRARGDARPESDPDIMIEIDPEARLGVGGYAGLNEYIAGLFDGPVDVVNLCLLKVNRSVVGFAISGTTSRWPRALLRA